jgi:hypothetical protein
MAKQQTQALSEVLDLLENTTDEESITIDDVVEKLGYRSFASLMLVFSLISTSPASAIPGVTAIVAVIVFFLVVQIMIGKECLWLPGFIAKRKMPTKTLCEGIGWLRRPVRFVEKFLRPRMTHMLHRPWLFLPLFLVSRLQWSCRCSKLSRPPVP